MGVVGELGGHDRQEHHKSPHRAEPPRTHPEQRVQQQPIHRAPKIRLWQAKVVGRFVFGTTAAAFQSRRRCVLRRLAGTRAVQSLCGARQSRAEAVVARITRLNRPPNVRGIRPGGSSGSA